MDNIGFQTLKFFAQLYNYNRWLFDIFSPYLQGEILEIGCGIGTLTKFILKKRKVSCIDLVPEYVEIVKKRLGLEKVVVGDITDLNTFWHGELYDTIVCLNVLEHIVEDELALKNMYSILKKHGRLTLSVPAHQALYGSLDEHLGHIKRYELDELIAKCKQCGFRVEQKKYINLFGIFGWFYNGKVLKRKIISNTQLKLYDLILPLLKLFEKSLNPATGLDIILTLKKE